MIANVIAIFRMAASIVLLFCPVVSPIFYALYLIAGLSDMVDGIIARKTNSVSEFCAQIVCSSVIYTEGAKSMDLQEQYSRLLRYCFVKTKDRYLAEDIVQESYLRFWQSHSYRDTGREMAYLYTIARNLCMDEFRKPVHVSIEECTEPEAGSRYGPEEVIIQEAVREAMDKLPDDLREIIALRYVSELSAADIGKVVGMSRFAVHRRLKEGLALLKKELT